MAVSNKCGEMLTVEVHQVVFELLMQKGLTAIGLLCRWKQVVLVVVDPDASSQRHFDLRNARSADPGLPQNTVTFDFGTIVEGGCGRLSVSYSHLSITKKYSGEKRTFQYNKSG